MQEPYKSCWECKTCDTLQEHVLYCEGALKASFMAMGYKKEDAEALNKESRAKLKR